VRPFLAPFGTRFGAESKPFSPLGTNGGRLNLGHKSWDRVDTPDRIAVVSLRPSRANFVKNNHNSR